MSIKTQQFRIHKDEIRTDPALFLSSKRNVTVYGAVLVHPDLIKNKGKQPDQSERWESRYTDGVAARPLTVPASRADETRMHWLASAGEEKVT